MPARKRSKSNWRRPHLEPAGAVSALLLVTAIACAGKSVTTGEAAGGNGGTAAARALGTGASGGVGGSGTRGGDGGTGATDLRGGSGGASARGGSGIAGDNGGPRCGNNMHDAGEECDDGNRLGLDGCTVGCQVERDAACPEVGPCNLTVTCGDSVLGLTKEQCDDGNARSGDGCSSTCQLEPGWLCPTVGVPCRPVCGDGVIHPPEECEDGNTASGDGCSSACRIEYPRCTTGVGGAGGSSGAGAAAGEGGAGPGGADGAGQAGSAASSGADVPACKDPVCGDGRVDAPEECDDGVANDNDNYAGCNASCHFAPFCGDGLVAVGIEECDLPAAASDAQKSECIGCHVAPYCGDGAIDAALGEQCDNGLQNGKGSCRTDCTLEVR